MFSPLRGTANSKTTLYLLSYSVFRLNALKGTIKTPAVDLLMLNTLRGAKIVVLTLKRYDDHPCLFYMGVSPQGLVIRSTLVIDINI